jgi:hypothetical protein
MAASAGGIPALLVGLLLFTGPGKHPAPPPPPTHATTIHCGSCPGHLAGQLVECPFSTLVMRFTSHLCEKERGTDVSILEIIGGTVADVLNGLSHEIFTVFFGLNGFF